MNSEDSRTRTNNQRFLFGESRRSLLHIAVMVSMAISQPIYEILARYPEFFVARRAEWLEIALMVFVLSGVIPFAIWLSWVPIRRFSQRVSMYILAILLSGLVGIFTLQLLGTTVNLNAGSQLALSLVAAIGFFFLYLRTPTAGSLLSILTPVVVLFPVIFLFFSPISKVLFQPKLDIPGSTIESRTPVIFIVFDELPTTTLMNENGEIDDKVFPSFSDLARNSTWFRNATTVAAGTLQSLPALLTGSYPSHTKIPSFVDYPENLFAMLGHSYELQVVESVTALCAPELCKKLPSLFRMSELTGLLEDVSLIYLHLLVRDEYRGKLPTISENWSNFLHEGTASKPISIDKEGKPGWRIVQEIEEQSAPKIIKASWQDWDSIYQQSVNEIEADKENFLHFQHVQLPHVPWRYLPSGKQYRDTFVHGKAKNDTWVKEQPWVIAQEFQRHILQTAYVDRLLANLLKKLRGSELFDASLIIVTSDHGASFQVGTKRRSPESGNLADLAGVPLFIKVPYQNEGKISETHVRTIDIVPTIAAILNIETPWAMDGYNVFSKDYPEQTRVSVVSTYGEEYWIDIDELKSRKWVLDWKSELFGPIETRGDLFAMGEGRKYYNLNMEEIPLEKGKQILGELNKPEQFQDVDITSRYSPSRVSGVIKAGADTETSPSGTVLVSINSIIRGTGKVFAEVDEAGKFAVMVSENSFKMGRNAVSLLYIPADGKSGDMAREVVLSK